MEAAMPRKPTVLALARNVGGYYHGELLAGLVRQVAAAGGRVVVAGTLEPGTDGIATLTPPTSSSRSPGTKWTPSCRSRSLPQAATWNERRQRAKRLCWPATSWRTSTDRSPTGLGVR